MSGAMQDLPAGWCNSTLATIATPRTGKANPQGSPDAKFIGMEQVEAHTMHLLGTVAAGSMRSSANTFQPSDVLYGRLRAYLNKVYQPDFAGLCSGEFIVLPENQALHGRFVKYRLNAADFVRFASHLNTGDRPRVDWDQIKAFGVSLPPRSEQERIADALDELFSDLDAGIAALERAREKLKLYRAAVLKAAVEGALTAEWRAQHPDAEPASELSQRVLVERRRRWEEAQLQKFKQAGKQPPKNWKAKYKEPIAPDTSTLPALPEGWCWASFDQLLWELRSGTSQTSGREQSSYPVLKSSAVRHGKVDLADLNYFHDPHSLRPENFLQPRDFLITRLSGSVDYVGCTAVVGEVGSAAIQFPDRIFCAKLVPSSNGEYLTYCFQHSHIRKELESAAKSTAGHQRISITDLRPLCVPLPSCDEQAAIVDAVEEQLSVIDHLEADLGAKLKSAQALRQSILRDAFAGKLVPQDPNDEPASVLLERIAAEREQRMRELKAAKQTKPKAMRKRAKQNKSTTIA